MVARQYPVLETMPVEVEHFGMAALPYITSTQASFMHGGTLFMVAAQAVVALLLVQTVLLFMVATAVIETKQVYSPEAAVVGLLQITATALTAVRVASSSPSGKE
jgi:hypothetical protein